MELTVEFESMEEMKEIFGILDENIHLIEKGTNTEIIAREGRAVISGNMQQAEMAKQVILKLCEQFRQQEYIDENKISYFLDLAGDGEMQSGLGGHAGSCRGNESWKTHQMPHAWPKALYGGHRS